LTQLCKVFDVASYLPDAFVPSYLVFREKLLSWLEILGIKAGGADTTSGTILSSLFCLHAEFLFCDIYTEASRARQVLSDAEHSLKLTHDELQTAREDLSDLFDPEGFGAAGEWKKLDGLCLEKDTGECVPSAIHPLTGRNVAYSPCI